MNVWGSGGSHTQYFKKIDNVIIDLFNKVLHTQPAGIIDIGCGDGAFLRHAYNVITPKPLRGNHITEYPLKIVGVDINNFQW